MAKTIMLACAGGMSSSLLVTKMKKAAETMGLEVTIFAVGADAIPTYYQDFHPDVILLGPQVNYMLEKVTNEVSVPVQVIGMKDYGQMKGSNVLQQALSLMKRN